MDFEKMLAAADEEERLKLLVDFARRAPSSHNSQPWLFKIRNKTIELWGNTKRFLPLSDSNNRQFFISLGCALENLLVAIDYYGLPVKVVTFPEPEQKFLAARLEFGHLNPTAKKDPGHLIHAISRRHSNRYDYDNRVVPDSFIESIKNLEKDELMIQVVSEESKKKELITIAGEATETAFLDAGFTTELSRWIKPSLKKYRDGMPGYNLGIPWPVSFIMPFAIKRINVSKPQRRMIEKTLSATPSFLIISTKSDEPRSWLWAGRVLEGVWLMATACGLKLSPLAAAIEIGDFYKKVQSVLQTNFRPQIFCRIGYSDKIPKVSPRLQLQEIILD